MKAGPGQKKWAYVEGSEIKWTSLVPENQTMPAGWYQVGDEVSERTHHFEGGAIRRIPPQVMAQRAAAERRATEREKALLQIQALEASQPRAVREALLTGNASRLQEIEDKIVALRPLVI